MIYIGIDPDTKKCGYAEYDSETKEFTAVALAFWEVVKKLEAYRSYPDARVIIDAGWLNRKSNFHYHGDKPYIGQAVAKKVGRNHQVGMLLVEYCRRHNIEYTEVRPVKGKPKLTPEAFEALTGISTKNQDIIDAGVLCYGLT